MSDQSFRFNSLYTLSEVQLHEVLQPFYEEALSDFQKDELPPMTYDQVVHEIYQNLQANVKAPIELESEAVVASLVADDANAFIDINGLLADASGGCATAVYVVVADAIGLILTYFGIKASVVRNATKRLLNELGPKTLNGFMSKIHDISHASGFPTQVKEILGLISQIKNALGLSAIISAVKKELTGWGAALAALTIAAQMGIWFMSDGLALLAELALGSTAVYTTIKDASKALTACNLA